MTSEAREIVARLTAGQRETILRRAGSFEEVTDPAIDELWFSITKHHPGHFSISLTARGRAARAELERQEQPK